MGDRINDRFDLHGSAARSVDSLFNDAGEVTGAVTWVSVIILVLSATSFTRALQRMFQRAYQTDPGSWREAWRGLAWLAAFGLWIVVSSPLRNALADVGGVVFAIAVSTVFGFVVWLATPAILLGARDWRRLLPGALVSAMLGALLGAASGIYVPIVLTWSADRYGLIGVAFSIQSWLLAAAFVVVIGAVVGAVASERSPSAIAPRSQRPSDVVRSYFRTFESGGVDAAAEFWHPDIEWRADRERCRRRRRDSRPRCAPPLLRGLDRHARRPPSGGRGDPVRVRRPGGGRRAQLGPRPGQRRRRGGALLRGLHRQSGSHSRRAASTPLGKQALEAVRQLT